MSIRLFPALLQWSRALLKLTVLTATWVTHSWESLFFNSFFIFKQLKQLLWMDKIYSIWNQRYRQLCISYTSTNPKKKKEKEKKTKRNINLCLRLCWTWKPLALFVNWQYPSGWLNNTNIFERPRNWESA